MDAARQYRTQGLWVTPVLGKAPVLSDWPNRLLDGEEIGRLFRSEHNVGVLLGPSGLADLDFDDLVAVRALHSLAPTALSGAAVFEHNGRPHLIVKAAPVETRRFKRRDGSTLMELRGNGAQTVFPPSVHSDGLPYSWVKECEPCEVPQERLTVLAAMVATVAYASEFWREGSRHELSLALAGFLARRVDEPDVLAVVRAVANVANDADFRDREAAVVSTIQRLKAGDSVVGLPSLEVIAPDLAHSLASWWSLPTFGVQGTSKGKASQADALVKLGKQAQLFHDSSGAAFARLIVGAHSEIWPVQSKTFRNWLRREHFMGSGKAATTDALNAACGVLDAMARFDGATHELQNRVASLDGAVYYDLADSAWRAVRIDANGWQLIDEPPILFRRYAHQLPQVLPVLGGNLSEVLRFLNIQAEDQLLMLAWLVAAFLPGIPHPVPDFNGEKGSGKSVGQRVLRRLIDPSKVESLAFPNDVRELVQQLSHHYAPVYDNVDSLPPWISDVVCRAVTGEGFSKRELYSDDEDVIYSYRRVIMLNGVNVVARRPDLLDRSILIGLDRISRSDRREEADFWTSFEQARPQILGAVFDTLSKAINIYPTLRLPGLERMADFTRWGASISEALGNGAGPFLRSYSANLGVQTLEAVQGHAVGAAVLALMGGRDEWSGSPTELLVALEEAGEDARLFRRGPNGKVDAKGWPGAPHVLSRRLNEVRSNLADLGFLVLDERSSDQRMVTIRRAMDKEIGRSVTSVVSVSPTQPPLKQADAGDGNDASLAHEGGEPWEAVIT